MDGKELLPGEEAGNVGERSQYAKDIDQTKTKGGERQRKLQLGWKIPEGWRGWMRKNLRSQHVFNM